jgi:hypothetical protein
LIFLNTRDRSAASFAAEPAGVAWYALTGVNARKDHLDAVRCRQFGHRREVALDLLVSSSDTVLPAMSFVSCEDNDGFRLQRDHVGRMRINI